MLPQLCQHMTRNMPWLPTPLYRLLPTVHPVPCTMSMLSHGTSFPYLPTPHAIQLTPPPPGVNHYETLRRIETEARRQVEASRTLSAYLASMTNSALSSSWGGGSTDTSLRSLQTQPVS